ncbi:MAG: PorP/SprF family type IX secretion system membrane protein [Sediminibacterium sp.]|nr:PorP/SprF family type IX secretion system membrane protein [Sediminibacterium sp.]MDP3129142.1 PorP/SprF family type IX secretion system membrane protein [Sediminibacterium sp.]MDP3665795.1 PorP/SprF family type IX secretion system membrane protein [Sediminibacterium sp.]
MGLKNIHSFFFLLCFIISSSAGYGQDPHFSQYFSSPLTFNPAMTGYFNGAHRFSFNVRNQWAALGDPYTTGTASFDTKIFKNAIGSNDRWGLGVHALYDQSSGGIYKNSYLSVSTGFNKGLDAEGDQSIGIGVQASIAGNSVDFSKISFNSQFTGGGFDLSIPSGETILNRAITYVDLNAGILYNYTDESGNQFSLGAAMFHILRPKLSYFSNNNPQLAQRFTIHAGAGFAVGEQDNIFVTAHLMEQGGANEYVLGAAYGITLGTSDKQLYTGAWLRVNDAVYPYLGLRANEYQVGLSYDITRSGISRVNKWSGSTELSFIYYFNNSGKKKGIPCFF